MILLFATIILAVVCLFRYSFVPWTKALMSLTNLIIMIATLLIPLGFSYLDDDCKFLTSCP